MTEPETKRHETLLSKRIWQGLASGFAGFAMRIVMGLLFFAVVTPIGMVMRWSGGDPLRLRLEREKPSYWLARRLRDGRQTSMTRQF